MKKFTFLVLPFLLLFSSCNRQNPGDYEALIAEARRLFEAGEYEDSGESFSEAFQANRSSDSTQHHYEAARAWALANRKDSAFEQLSILANEGQYADLLQISTDSDFNSLRTDDRWLDVLKIVSKNKQEAGMRLAEVAILLETVHYDDQKYRHELEEIQEKYGQDSNEMKVHWEVIRKQDSVNLVKVEQVLQEYGWPGYDIIGRRANAALFLVIQHADLETQEKYLPMLREAVKKGSTAPSDLALLEDRVALKQGRKQIYGSQIGRDRETGEYYVSPLIDPGNVDQRRAEVGLGPLQEYISNWGLTWDADEYKKKLPHLEAQK